MITTVLIDKNKLIGIGIAEINSGINIIQQLKIHEETPFMVYGFIIPEKQKNAIIL